MRIWVPSQVASPYLGLVSVVAAVSSFGYARLLDQQGDWPEIDARQWFVLGFLIALSVVSAVATFARPALVRAASAAFCAFALLPLGVLAAFSIGLVLIVAGAFAVIAWLSIPRSQAMLAASAISALAAIAILTLGFAATG
jgi:hypothetical protein